MAKLAVLWLVLYGGLASAAAVQVMVVGPDNQPVPNVAVYLNLAAGQSTAAQHGTKAIMDQVDLKFEPSLLVVQTGTQVAFPNSDPVAHHVYSFSHPNQFKLPLYKGNAHAPVTFEESGVVSLGCNVHDNMLGYILVVDTPLFGKTNGNGIAVLNVADHSVDSVSIWSPRFRDKPSALTKSTNPSTETQAQIRFQLTKTLRPPMEQSSDALSWSDY